MKVLLINGSTHEKGCTFTALSEVAATLKKRGIDSEILYLGKKPVSDCIACGKCRKTGVCAIDDIVNETAARLEGFDGLIIGSPVYYGGPTALLTAFLDRLFFSASRKMVGMLGASIVSCRRGGASAAFDRLNKYFTIAKMPVASSQYWNQVHGSTPDDVRKDEEGLQTMRTLAETMAWLLKSIEAGQKAGLTLPDYEAPLRTDFIE